MKQSGIGLLEALLAAGLLGGVAIGVAKLSEMGQKSGKSTKQSFELTALSNELRSFLGDTNVCKKNFAGKVLNGSVLGNTAAMINIDSLTDVNGNVRFDKTKIYGNNELKIVSMKIGGFDPHDSTASSNILGESKFVIEFEKVGNTYSSNKIIREFVLSARIQDSASKKILTCSAMAAGGEGFWSPAPMGIHYSDGFVGVGQPDPRVPLHVIIDGPPAPTFPYAGRNMGIVVENPQNTPTSHSGVSIVTTPGAWGGIQFADRDLADGTPEIWDGVLVYKHDIDIFQLSTKGGGANGGELFLKGDGHLVLGYDGLPSDPNADQFTLDIRSEDKVAGGSGIRVLGNEAVTGQGRARIILQDLHQWALNSGGTAGPFPGSFHLGHRETGKYPFAVSAQDKLAVWPPLSGPGAWANVREFEIYTDMEVMNSKTLYVSKIDSVTANLSVENSMKVNGNLNVSGNIASTGPVTVNGDVAAATFTTTSDRRYKQDIEKLSGPLEKLEKINGVQFRWKGDPRALHLGVIAQEVREVYPEAVHEDREGKLRVNYDALIPPLIESIKELRKEVSELKKELARERAGKKI